MTLPLPQLDDRRWRDLVEEGRALVPRFAPGWSDHNIHDPGITLLELHAWLAETAIYRANRIPERHRRKFLALVGVEPHPPQPALTALAFALPLGATPFSLPAGAEFESADPAIFRTLRDLDLASSELVAVQTSTESDLTDRSAEWREGLAIPALGNQAQPEDALYLGFRAWPDAPLALFLHFENSTSGFDERRRLIAEAEAQSAACQPILPDVSCDEEGNAETIPCFEQPPAVPAHPSARMVWEIFTSEGWTALDEAPWPERPEPGQVHDDTRSLTFDGLVEFQVPANAVSTALGSVVEELFYVRCRLVSGVHDALPRLTHIAINGVLAVETLPATASLTLAAGLVATGDAPTAGDRVRFDLTLANDETVTALHFLEPDATSEAPEVRVLAFEPAGMVTPGRLAVELVPVGRGDGHPHQPLTLPEAPVFVRHADALACARERPRLFTFEEGAWRAWTLRPDFDASRRIDAHFTLDATSGEVLFGDGERGRVVPEGALIFASWHSTRGSSGNLAAATALRPISEEASLANALALDGLTPDERNLLDEIASSPLAAHGGADQEDLNRAIGRAIEWRSAHERLVDLCEEHRCRSLDEIPRETVAALTVPQRGASLLDLERLALDVPGTRVARARALADFDPVHGCLNALGTVTVIVVPEHPASRPVPSSGLLASVRRYLDRRRLVTTRLRIVGPEYLEVSVRARLRARAFADRAEIAARVHDALNDFLDPLHGGPRGLGWPFGRDVFRSEILERIDRVPGVDHVLELSLTADAGEPRCGNLVLCPTWLVTPGEHHIEVQGATP